MGISTACASGSMTLAVAARMIRQGSASIMIAGGSEALCWFTLSGFNSLQTLDPEPCRPFDQGRKGLNLGEGAAMLVLSVLFWTGVIAIARESRSIIGIALLLAGLIDLGLGVKFLQSAGSE